MSWALPVAVAALATVALLAAVGASRRRRRRLDERRALRERVRQALEREAPALVVGEAEAPALAVRDRSGNQLSLPWDRLAAAAGLDGLAASLAFQLGSSVAPHGEALALNKQARGLAPLLIPRAWLAWFGEGAPPHTALADTGLAAIYRFLDDPQARGRLVYLDRRSLEATGLDVEGLHGAMMALLAQQLDEEPIRRLGSRPEPLVLADRAAVSGAFLFLLPELLAAGRELVALVPDAGCLVLADATRLDEALVAARQARADDPSRASWLCARPLRVRADGIRLVDGIQLATGSDAGC
jgi:hypothetical protein